MAGLINKKLGASTIIEVLISMVIMMIVFTIGIGIYTNITTSGLSVKRQIAEQQITKMMTESKVKGDLTETTVMIDSIIYEKKILPYEGFSDLAVLEIKAELNGKELGKAHEILPDNFNAQKQ